jgi:hypothetical protein
MNLESDKRLNIQLRLDFSSASTGEARQAGGEDIESLSVANEPERPADTRRIMEEVSERKNLKEALRQVRSNKGSAGVDGMTVDKLGDYLKQHWPAPITTFPKDLQEFWNVAIQRGLFPLAIGRGSKAPIGDGWTVWTAAVHCARQRMGDRPRSGKILRSSQS